MKNILVGIVASCLLLTGCAESQTDERGRLIAGGNEKGKFCFYTHDILIIAQYIVIDGHEYLICSGDRKFGITHSPKCDCHSRK